MGFFANFLPDFLSFLADFLTTFFIILLLLVFFLGQNWQGQRASRQIKKSLNNLEKWRDYGIDLIMQTIEPIREVTITDQEIEKFINEMLEFFVINPSKIEPFLYDKLHFLMSKREHRFQDLIKRFLPNVNDDILPKINSLLSTTMEIDHLYKKVRHNLIVGEKTKSYLFLLQTASDTTQTMIKAKAYVEALDSFMNCIPIGDSIGPLSIKRFVEEISNNNSNKDNNKKNKNNNNNNNKKLIKPVKLCQNIYFQELIYKNRKCLCLRAKGPESRVGSPGNALEMLLLKLKNEEKKINQIITIDAIAKFEGEISGTIAQGLGVAAGAGKSLNLDKYQIETLSMKEEPSIPLEAIVCRESFKESVLPMSDKINDSIPKIIRILKQIIISQNKPGDTLVIIGIGNAIGVPL